MRYRFGPFEFDPHNARVTGPQGDLALRPMTLRLLQQLIEQAPQLLTHEQLLDRVWGRQAVTIGARVMVVIANAGIPRLCARWMPLPRGGAGRTAAINAP